MQAQRYALNYVGEGFSVLPVHRAVGGVCDCPSGSSCTSPGKHPIADLAPHGVHDASRDIARVAEFFADEHNIGIALGAVSSGLVVFDVDNEGIARQLLEDDVGLRDETAVAITGRGCHIYLLTTGSTQTIHLKTKDGDKIGELRGDGAYVLAPPSVHPRSTKAVTVNYRWLGGYPDMPPIASTGDALSRVRALLLSVGVETEDPKLSGVIVPDVPVKAVELPFELDHQKTEHFELYQMLTGTMPTNDRSGMLWNLAKTIITVAGEVGYKITDLEVAGVVKSVDAVEYRKYTGRSDADYRYLEIATKAANAVNLDDSSGITPLPPGPYTYDATNGLIFTGGRSGKHIANFKPLIEEELTIDDGNNIEREFAVSFSQPGGRMIRFTYTPDDVASESKLRKTLYSRTSPEFIVEADGFKHLIPAMQSFSVGYYKQRRIFAYTGFAEVAGEPIFLLPNAFAITGRGIDTSVQTGERVGREWPPAFRGYGTGVRPCTSRDELQTASEALQCLLRVAAPEVIVPILVQILAAPLCSLGYGESPPLVHVLGKTGSLKTSTVAAALSIFGYFNSESVPASWSGTPNSLQMLLYLARDLPFLIDDYKVSMMGRNEASRLIQNYADRTTRTRLTSDQRMQQQVVPRAALISTGEDIWESQQSMLSRTIIVELSSGDIDKSLLLAAQNEASRGALALLGGTYLSWLCRETPQKLKQEYFSNYQEIRAQLNKREVAKHPRFVSNLSSLFSVGRIIARFLNDVLPDCAEDFRDKRNDALRRMIELTVIQDEEADFASPFQQLAEEVRIGIQQSEAWLTGIKILYSGATLTRYEDESSASLGWAPTTGSQIGFASEDSVYLTERGTYGWYLERLGRRRIMPTFSWKAVTQEAQKEHGGHMTLLRPANVRCLQVPREVLTAGSADRVDQEDHVK